MSAELANVKFGFALVLLGLFLNIGLGIAFGVNEDAFKDYVAEGIAANPTVHDDESQSKIWRYGQRVHFHAGGIAAFCLALIAFVMFSDLKRGLKRTSAILIGLASFYPFAWLTMFVVAPSIGRDAAHDHILTHLFTFVGVVGLLAGTFILAANVFLGLFRET